MSAVCFSGFYEIRADQTKLDQLPIGKRHGCPYLPCSSFSVQGKTWAYVLSGDDAFQAGLQGGKIEFQQSPDQEIMDTHAKDDEKNQTSDAKIMSQVMVRWANARIGEMFAAAFKKDFGGKS